MLLAVQVNATCIFKKKGKKPLSHISFFDLFISLFLFQDFSEADQCRTLGFTSEKAFNGKRLVNHVIRIVEVKVKKFCEALCFMEPYCVSINYDNRVRRNGKYKCELNNVTHEGHERELIKEENYFYHATEVSVILCNGSSNVITIPIIFIFYYIYHYSYHFLLILYVYIKLATHQFLMRFFHFLSV